MVVGRYNTMERGTKNPTIAQHKPLRTISFHFFDHLLFGVTEIDKIPSLKPASLMNKPPPEHEYCKILQHSNREKMSFGCGKGGGSFGERESDNFPGPYTPFQG